MFFRVALFSGWTSDVKGLFHKVTTDQLVLKTPEQHWEADLFTNLVDLFSWMGQFLELLFMFASLGRLWGLWGLLGLWRLR